MLPVAMTMPRPHPPCSRRTSSQILDSAADVWSFPRSDSAPSRLGLHYTSELSSIKEALAPGLGYSGAPVSMTISSFGPGVSSTSTSSVHWGVIPLDSAPLLHGGIALPAGSTISPVRPNTDVGGNALIAFHLCQDYGTRPPISRHPISGDGLSPTSTPSTSMPSATSLESLQRTTITSKPIAYPRELSSQLVVGHPPPPLEVKERIVLADDASLALLRKIPLPAPHKSLRLPPRLRPTVPKALSEKAAFLLRALPTAAGTVHCSIYRDSKATRGIRYWLLMEVPANSYVTVDQFGQESIEENDEKLTTLFLCSAKQRTDKGFVISADRQEQGPAQTNVLALVLPSPTFSSGFSIFASTATMTTASHSPAARLSNSGPCPSHSCGSSSLEEVAVLAVSPPSGDGVVSQFDARIQVASEQPLGPSASRSVSLLRMVPPEWNDATMRYEADFGPRVTEAGRMNFQLGDDQRCIRLTFGQARGSVGRFVLDFAAPLSPVQAFGIALVGLVASSLGKK